MDKKWWKNAVVYEIYPKSFCDSNGDGIGDLAGVQTKLDYLKMLGVDVLWLCPIYPSGGYDNGYDITDYESIDPCYGTMDELRELLRQIHQRGMKLILDLVVNHTSDRHPWFRKALADKTCPERAYYIWREGRGDGELPNNWGALFGGPAWTRDEESGQYYLGLFSPRQPDLNWENPALRRDIYAMMRRWLDLGIDGFRMDVISLIAKPEDFSDGPMGENGYFDPRARIAANPKLHAYLREMRRETLRGREVMVVGEASAVTLETAKLLSNPDGSELDMIFWFEHMDLDGGESFKWNMRKIPLTGLKRVMEKWQIGLFGCGWNALFWDNHDQPRMLSRLGDEGALRETSAKMLAVCLFFMQGTPFIFQGDELGMTNMHFTDPAQLRDSESIHAFFQYTGQGRMTEEQMLSCISEKSRDTSRSPMQWSHEPGGGFSTGEPWMRQNPNVENINAVEQIGRSDSVFSFYQKLIRMRKGCSVVVEGTFELYQPKDTSVFAYLRSGAKETLFVCCSFSQNTVSFPVPEEFMENTQLLLGNYERSSYPETGRLNPFEAVVLRKEATE